MNRGGRLDGRLHSRESRRPRELSTPTWHACLSIRTCTTGLFSVVAVSSSGRLQPSAPKRVHPKSPIGSSQAHWGQGHASRALALVLARTKRLVLARVAADTTNSLRILQKAGFVVVGQGRDLCARSPRRGRRARPRTPLSSRHRRPDSAVRTWPMIRRARGSGVARSRSPGRGGRSRHTRPRRRGRAPRAAH